jgi:hypothetical protein
MTELADSPMLAYLLAVLGSIMTRALADPALARKAAQQALDAYQPRTMMELIISGQILIFAISGMENLRLAAAETVSASMKLRLAGNANGLNRAARHNTQSLHDIRQTAPHPDWQVAEPTPGMPAPAMPSPKPPPPKLPEGKPAPGPNATNWATAMTSVAAKLSAKTPGGRVQRQFNALWIGALTTVAAEAAQTLRRAPTLRCESVAPPRQPRVVPLKPPNGSPRL